MSIADIKAWMADHVFLTIGIAVLLTLSAMWLSSEVLRKFHLRMIQTAAIAMIALGACVAGIGAGNAWLMLAGAGGIIAGLLAFYAGTRLDGTMSRKIDALEAELKKAKSTQPLHFVIDPGQAGNAAKTAAQK